MYDATDSMLLPFFTYNRIYFSKTISNMAKEKDYNRLKVVLAEKKKTNKWLAEQLGKDPATVSKWCTNSAQPGLETLYQIAASLEVDVKDLLVPNMEENVIIYKK